MSEMKNTPNQNSQESEIAIKFGKGLAQPFTGKDGWQSFVVPAKAVHENHYGKGLWMKLPLNGSTTVSRDVRTGYDESGKGIYEKQRRSVTNIELKAMVESYKTQEQGHAIDAPGGSRQETAAPSKPKPRRSYSMER